MNITPEQIKQTVAEIRERHNHVDTSEDWYGHVTVAEGDAAHDNRGQLLEITDHLQKTIEAQAAEIERLKKRINDIDPERKS